MCLGFEGLQRNGARQNIIKIENTKKTPHMARGEGSHPKVGSVKKTNFCHWFDDLQFVKLKKEQIRRLYRKFLMLALVSLISNHHLCPQGNKQKKTSASVKSSKKKMSWEGSPVNFCNQMSSGTKKTLGQCG